MPPNRHAVLSASSSHRWLHCNPSARLELEFEDRETEAAAEGTAAHALAEHKLRKALKMRSTRPVSKYDSDEMEMYTDGYLEFVLEAIEEARQDCPDPKVLIEQRLDFSCYVPDGFGTGDCLIVADKLLHIIDLKYGQGVLVNAEENPQMMLYFVEDDHPAVVTRQIFMAVQDELKRRAKEKTQPVGSKSSFTGKIRCSCCGKNYRRKTTPYNIVWCCSTYNSKGKKYCPDSKVIPEETLKRVAAEILKTDGFSDEAFETQICTIEAHPGNLLRFIFTDDSTTDYVWKDRSRSESWTDEMKAAAGRKTKERNVNHGK